MNNFYDFILKDIEFKKNMITSLPTKTKTNIKKLNKTIDEVLQKYESYKEILEQYIKVKNRSLALPSSNKKIEDLKEQIESLETLRLYINPFNTYFEKMGFDDLIYKISNYSLFNFKSLDSLLNEFFDKFEEAGIIVTSKDFDLTYYVNTYMSAFLDVRNQNVSDYKELNLIFENLYWQNPDLINHIELNFRLIIEKNAKKFEEYIKLKQEEEIAKHNISTYNECIDELTKLHNKLNDIQKEDINDIVNGAISGEFDITKYLKDSKIRIAAFESLLNKNTDYTNSKVISKVSVSLERLLININEYSNYLKLYPLVEDFINTYKELPTYSNKELKSILNNIKNKVKKLNKLNKKPFFKQSENTIKNNRIESVRIAKELYDLYKEYDKEYFNCVITKELNSNMTVIDFLNIYSSHTYFKKLAIQRVYEIESYDEIISWSDMFDDFALDPTNVIIDWLPLFEENNIPAIIANKYKLDNIIIDEESLNEESLDILKNKIILILRVWKIEQSQTSISKIVFMTKAYKLFNKNN